MKVHKVASMPSSDIPLVVPNPGDFVAFKIEDKPHVGRLRFLDTEFEDCSLEVLQYEWGTFFFEKDSGYVNCFLHDIIGIFQPPTMALKKKKIRYQFNRVEVSNWLNKKIT